MCYKCSNYNSHLRGNQCPSCQHPYIFSFVSFGNFSILYRTNSNWLRILFSFKTYWHFFRAEILPLVEFSPEDDIPDEEVERLLLAPPKTNTESLDPFVDTMINEEVSDILPLTLDRDALRALDPTTILIAKWPSPLKTRYYRNLMPEWQISMCSECLQVMIFWKLLIDL